MERMRRGRKGQWTIFAASLGCERWRWIRRVGGDKGAWEGGGLKSTKPKTRRERADRFGWGGEDDGGAGG